MRAPSEISIRSAKRQSEVNDLLPKKIEPSESTAHTTGSPSSSYAPYPSAPASFSSADASTDTPFSQQLWTYAQSTATKAQQTCFIKGIGSGMLDPNAYGKYTVQDVIYCWKSTENLKILLADPKNAPYKPFLQGRVDSFSKYTTSLFEQWNIADPAGIKLDEAAQQYTDYQAQVFKNSGIMLAFVSMLPCEMLWIWLANQMKDDVKPSNVYSFWINENASDGPGKIATFLDQNSSGINMDDAKIIFANCMQGECNFFASPCSERTEKINFTSEVTPQNTCSLQ